MSLNRRHATALTVTLSALCGTALCILGGDELWFASDMREFAPHFSLALLLVAVILVVLDFMRAGIVTLACSLSLIFMLATAGAQAAKLEDGNGKFLTVAGINALINNDTPGRVVAWINERKPDLVVVVESTPHLDDLLGSLSSTYPYRIKQMQPNTEFPGNVVTGMSILSRFPLGATSASHPIGREDRPLMTAEVSLPYGKILLAAMHPPPPRNESFEAQRTDYIAYSLLHASATRRGMPAIAVGDFNATPWSAALTSPNGEWRIASPGGATWPRRAGALGIPIDLAALTHEVSFIGAEIGPDTGSDHAPVLWKFGLTFKD